MKIALISSVEIDATHGTGVFLNRIFETHSALYKVVPSELSPPLDLPKDRGAPLSRVITFLKRKVHRFFLARASEKRLKQFDADIGIFIVTDADSFAYALHFLRAVPGTPMIIWVLDLLVRLPKKSVYFDLIARSTTEIWFLAPQMQEQLLALSDKWRPDLLVRVREHWPVTQIKVTEKLFPPSCGNPRLIVLGNFWDPVMANELALIWRSVRVRRPELGPIRWVCHEAGYQRLLKFNSEWRSELEWVGHISDAVLLDVLSQADLGVVPTSFQDDLYYSRFSVPSRIGDLAAAGLPLMVLASSNSATADYIRRYGLAELIDGPGEHAVNQIISLIDDHSRLKRLSEISTRHANAYFNLSTYRASVFADLAACVVRYNT